LIANICAIIWLRKSFENIFSHFGYNKAESGYIEFLKSLQICI